VIVKYRTTIGDGTFNWDSGWWSKRHVLGTSRTADIDLTAPDMNGNYLGKDPDQEWGTYTYDILVLEYAGADPIWTEGAAVDCNFLKRCRDGYHLWVPANLPAPNGDKPGHDVWKEVAEESGEEQLRGYYSLHSKDGLDAEAVEIVAVDPLLAEQTPPVGGSGAVGVGYGIEDTDQDGEFDGIALRVFGEDDFGTWRAVFTAADTAGLKSPHWRSHELIRMLVANAPAPPTFATFSPEENEFVNSARHARNVLVGRGWTLVVHAEDPTSPAIVRTAISGRRGAAEVVYLASHGMVYEPYRVASDVVYRWNNVQVTDDASQGANYHHGDMIQTNETDGPADDHEICTFDGVAQRTLGTYYAFALLSDGTATTLPTDRRGGPAGSCRQCVFLFVSACCSARSADSFVQVAKNQGGVRAALGYTRRMNAVLAAKFAEYFWDRFGALGRLSLSKAAFYASLSSCYSQAIQDFWTFYDGATLDETAKGLWDTQFRSSDMLRWPHDADPPRNVKGEFTWFRTR
jgi:hypothetical protein